MNSWILLVALFISVFVSPFVCECQNAVASNDHFIKVGGKTAFSKLSIANSTVWEAKADLVNLSPSTVIVAVKEVGRTTNGYKFSHCFGGSCADNEDRNELLSLSMTAEEANNSFRVYAKPSSNSATSGTVKYRFITANNSDSADVEFAINVKSLQGSTATGVKNIVNPQSATALSIFPNPASYTTSVDFAFGSGNVQGAYLKIYDLMGKEIAKYDVEENEGSLKINLRNFNEGVYFCSLIVNDKSLVTKRFIVTR